MKTAPETHEPLTSFREYPAAEMQARAAAFQADMARRRSVRAFSDKPVDRAVIEACVAAAGTAPSGANHQPWFFACVGSAPKKRQIRLAAEAEERAFYEGRASDEWL
ncbi:MAG: nitroreductase family protein, partial [Pseudomonadota bacterium]